MADINTMSANIKPIILCGGSGTRLWPLSRESFPKQFVSLVCGKSLLELTIDRVKKFSPPVCVANEQHRFLVRDMLKRELADCVLLNSRILLEPESRNTAAAMISAALMPDILATDLLLFLPSDHYIPDINAFIMTINAGISAADAGYIVTFGIQPTFPSTAYGYIKQGDHLFGQEFADSLVCDVECFIEKPPVDEAHEMLLSKKYLWNAGIFLCRASVLIDAMAKCAPDILIACKEAMQEAKVDDNFIRPDKNKFLKCRSESIDYALMENFDRVAVVPFEGVWSDVGSWNSVAALSLADDNGNRLNGNAMAIHSTNTYINATTRCVVALGTENLVIVDTPDAVLVSAINKVEQVKDVVTRLKKEGKSEAVKNRKVARPWGWYDSIDLGDRFQVKRISVKPGASLSLQMHHHRAEHWIVVRGVAKVTNGDQVFTLEENQSTYIPIGVRHRLENLGNDHLEMIEVQSGSYLDEDDIVRFEDAYGRK